MGNTTGNTNLDQAKRAKNDEFYTRIEDIENELKHYRQHFRDKVVLLNCDDPEWSNFWRYFELNFDFLGLKKLISTHYTGVEGGNTPPSYKLELTGYGRPAMRTDLVGDGDFRSPECMELLEEADIVVTNPPFSLFREFVAQLIEHDKKFLIVGGQNAITYKDTWELVQAGKVWLGTHSGDMEFRVPEDAEPRETRYREDESGRKWRSLGNACWFTNLDHSRRHEEIPLFRRYDPESYPSYDNYDAIEVSRVANIPMDYSGYMGVPITFLGKYNPQQFTIVGASAVAADLPDEFKLDHFKKHGLPYVDGNRTYQRIFVRRNGVAS